MIKVLTTPVVGLPILHVSLFSGSTKMSNSYRCNWAVKRLFSLALFFIYLFREELINIISLHPELTLSINYMLVPYVRNWYYFVMYIQWVYLVWYQWRHIFDYTIILGPKKSLCLLLLLYHWNLACFPAYNEHLINMLHSYIHWYNATSNIIAIHQYNTILLQRGERNYNIF